MSLRTILFFVFAYTLLGQDPLQHNAVIFGDVTTWGGHSDGSVIVGGDWNGSYYEVRQHGDTPSIDGYGVYVGGDINFSSHFRVLNGGIHPGSVDVSALYAESLALSQHLSSLPGSVPSTRDPNNLRWQLDGDVTVFSLQADQITGYRTLDFQGTGQVIINVYGDEVNWNWSVNYDPSQIIWNFVDALEVNIAGRQFTGTILAPLAHVQTWQNVNGTIIAESWTNYNSAEIHSYPFELTAVPEPGSALLIVVVGFLAILRRSR